MAAQSSQIDLPEDLIHDIDEVAGSRGRVAFITETMRAEVKRQRLLTFLSNPEPVWKDEDHPELAQGAAAYVRQMRSFKSERTMRIERKLAEDV